MNETQWRVLVKCSSGLWRSRADLVDTEDDAKAYAGELLNGDPDRAACRLVEVSSFTAHPTGRVLEREHKGEWRELGP